jgi:hypothetical protein
MAVSMRAAVIAAVLVIVSSMGVGQANAKTLGNPSDYSDDDYAAELRVEGVRFNDPGLVAVRVCEARNEGIDQDDLIRDREAERYTSRQAIVIVLHAEYHWCPMFEMKADGTPAWVRDPGWPNGWAPADPAYRGVS